MILHVDMDYFFAQIEEKRHPEYEGKIIAVCDDNLLGKKFEEKKLQLDLTSNFYRGEEKKEEEIIELLRYPCILNAVGKKSMNFFLKLGKIDKKRVLIIKDVPHAQAIVG